MEKRRIYISNLGGGGVGGFGGQEPRWLFSLNEKAVNGGHAPFNHARWSKRSMPLCRRCDTPREIVFQVRVPVPMETGLAPVLAPRSGPPRVPAYLPPPPFPSSRLVSGYRITGVCLLLRHFSPPQKFSSRAVLENFPQSILTCVAHGE